MSLRLLDLCIALHIESNEMKGLDSVLTNAYVPNYSQVLVTCHYLVIKYISPGITVILILLFSFFFFKVRPLPYSATKDIDTSQCL